MVEGEGVELADGRRLTMAKGKVEMEKQTGAETAYAKHTKRVLELIIVGIEKEGVTQAYATDASAGEEGVGVGVWKGVGETGTEKERVRCGVRGCTCPKGWDNDDGELFGILLAVSMGYEEGKQAQGEDSEEVVMVLTDSWSMVQAVEGTWKMGGAAEGAARARTMLVQKENEGDTGIRTVACGDSDEHVGGCDSGPVREGRTRHGMDMENGDKQSNEGGSIHRG